MYEQQSGVYDNPYKFNAKELDQETGLYYYGARYYNPRISVWYGVDPLAVYNPVMEDEFYGDGQHNDGTYFWGNNNSYIYTYQNPIIFVDPNGKQNVSSYIQGKFSALSRVIDDGSKRIANEVVIRGSGGLQMVGGVTEAVVGGIGGLLTAETGVGAVVGAATLANGLDNTVTGSKQLWTGENQNTYLHKGVTATSKAAGADDETAENIADGADIATLALGGGNSLKNTKVLRESGTGNINGISKGSKPGYGAQRRFDIHPLKHPSRKTSKLILSDWIKNNKIPVPHYHRGKGSNLKYHRPWEKGPDGKRRW